MPIPFRRCKAVLAACLMGVFVAGGCNSTPSDTPKPAGPLPAARANELRYGFVDMQLVMASSADGRQKAAELDRFKVQAAAQIEAQRAEIDGLQDRMRRSGDALPPAHHAQLQRDIESKTAAAARLQEQLNAELAARAHATHEAFEARVKAAAAEIGRDGRFAVIFTRSPIYHAAGAADLTAVVAQRMDGVAAPIPPARRSSRPIGLATVDAESLARSSPAGKQRLADMKQSQEHAAAKFDAMSVETRALRAQLDSNPLALTAEESSALLKRLNEALAAQERFRRDAAAELAVKREELRLAVENSARPELDRLAKEYGFALVLSRWESGVAYSDESADVTPAVLRRLGAAAPESRSPSPATRVGIIDGELLVMFSNAGREASAALQQEHAQAMGQINLQQQVILQLQARIAQDRLVLSEAELVALMRQIEDKTIALRASQAQANRRLQTGRDEMLASIDRQATPLVQQIAGELGYPLVLETGQSGVIYFDPTQDVTKAVIERMNAAPDTKPASP